MICSEHEETQQYIQKEQIMSMSLHYGSIACSQLSLVSSLFFKNVTFSAAFAGAGVVLAGCYSRFWSTLERDKYAIIRDRQRLDRMERAANKDHLILLHKTDSSSATTTRNSLAFVATSVVVFICMKKLLQSSS